MSKHPFKNIIFLFAGVALLFLPFLASAEEFVSLVGIPGVEPNERNLVSYLNALYILSISFGALFAVVRIAFAGVQYSVSGDNVSARSKAKSDIFGALFGLAILLATYIVLYTINPNLTNLNILENAQPAVLTAPTVTAITSAAPGTVTAPGAVSCNTGESKYTDDTGLVYCGKAYAPNPSDPASASTLTDQAASCKAEGGIFSPRNVRVPTTDANGVTTSKIERQFVCIK